MYRWLLCWRYLRTRYIALASVISVMLGVATLIVVNSVMDGFTAEMQGKMHGILSDVIIDSSNANGMTNPTEVQRVVRGVAGDDLLGMTTVVHVPAMVTIKHQGEALTRQINLIGIDKETYASVSDFRKYLMHPSNRQQLSFLLRESGYAPEREGFPESGWGYRRSKAARLKVLAELQKKVSEAQAENDSLRAERNAFLSEQIDTAAGSGSSTSDMAAHTGEENQVGNAASHGLSLPTSPFAQQDEQSAPPQQAIANRTAAVPAAVAQAPPVDALLTPEEESASKFDPEREQFPGIVLGVSIGTTRYRNMEGEVADYYYVQPGDDVTVTFPSSGESPTAIYNKFTVVDFYESKMSEYDSTFAFVPLEELQRARGMRDAISSVQLRLRAGADLDAVRDALRAQFPYGTGLQVNTWRDMQGALLAAVKMETTILNILLFLIIAVAGFGILATFFMIVVEKTKDIGILKSLGASGAGVASIFLGYGVLLGAFGAGVGAIAGLAFVANINGIADLLEWFTGQEVFDPTVYYFETIPTIVHPAMVVWVIIGAVAIAVLASVLPSIRAARMHPVEALRYE